MDDYIDVKIDIFEYTGQHARVRSSITIATLIREILREFDDLSGQPENYALFLADHDQPLEQSYTIEQLDIHPWDELMLDYRQRSIRRDLMPDERFSMRFEKTGKLYPVEWQPAIIGRPTKDPDHDMKLAINLASVPMGETISRTHAQLTVRDSVVYVERLAESNPVYLNGVEIPFRQSRPMRLGDRLEMGRSRLALVLERTEAQGFPVRPIEIPVVPKAPEVQPKEKEQPKDESLADLIEEALASSGDTAADGHSGGDITEMLNKKTVLVDLPAAPQEPPARSAPPSAALKLIKAHPAAVDEGLIGRVYPIGEFPFQIGRDVFGFSNDSGVSRKHACIEYDPQRRVCTITDLKSTNGVSVNGVILTPGQPHPLKPSDEINLGKQVTLCFVTGE